MRIDRNSFHEYFILKYPPNWDCPACRRGKLHLDLKNLTVQETRESLSLRAVDEWDLTWVQRTFVGKLICNNLQCGELYGIVGGVTENYDDFEEMSLMEETPTISERYYPHCITPPIDIFYIPEDISSDVEDKVMNVFKLFWIDKAACANAVRTCVEEILTDKRIPKRSKNKQNKLTLLSLHQRIEKFSLKNSDAAKKLMSIKWIGNTGSHSSDVLNDDLLDGLDLLKYVLEKLYTTHEKDIHKLSEQINKRRRPLNS